MAGAQVRCTDPEAAGGYGMTAKVAEDDMIPLERYRCAVTGLVLMSSKLPYITAWYVVM